ncbi:MAG: RNA methyltransferase [bacterium]|nr:RNA methyltransferase [bacterium]
MPYDAGLAARLEDLLLDRDGFECKKMFGGIGWLLTGNMCVGVYKDWLIARVGESAAAPLLGRDCVKPMDVTGKPMKGWLMISLDGLEDDDSLEEYVDLSTRFVENLPPKP